MTNLIPIVKPLKKNFVVVDMGSTKAACAVAQLTANKNLVKVLEVLTTPSKGIYGGKIINFKDAKETLSTLILQAEKILEDNIDNIYVNIANCGVKSRITTGYLEINNRKITIKDVHNLLNQVNEKFQEVIINSFPIEYELDNIQDINSPIGMYGNNLKGIINVVTVSRSEMLNLEHCINQFNLELKGCISSSFSSGLACLKEDEKELGSAIIDIGGGNTSIGVFMKRNLIYSTNIPIGGNHITKDIACAFNTSIAQAEEIKKLHGRAFYTQLDKDEVMKMPNIDDTSYTEIKLLDLTDVIRPRVEELLELINTRLQNLELNKIVLTGGTSKLTSLKELAQHILNVQVRIGYPNPFPGFEGPHTESSEFSALAGAVTFINIMLNDPLYNPAKKPYFTKMLELLGIK